MLARYRSPTSSSTSVLTFRFHLAIVANFLHHITSGSVPRIYGCVIGMQSGHTLEIYNSFVLSFDFVSGSLNLGAKAL
jgi:hypothetical protein